MKRAFGLLSAALVALALRAQAAPLTPLGAEDRLLVAFKENVGRLEQSSLLKAEGLELVAEIPSLRVALVRAPHGKAGSVLTRLAADPRVWRVEPDVWRKWIEAELPSLPAVMHRLPKLSLTGRAPAQSSEAELPWGVKRVNAAAAWSATQGSGVKVAVIDTGIDPTHPDLKDRVAGGVNALDKNAPWVDDHFHGTHVAGTIAATLDDKGVAGVAPKATLYAVKVLTKDGSGNLFAIMNGIMWCAQNGIQVANMSLGAPQEMPLLQYALQMAAGAGVTIVAAAGNDGKAVNWPAAYPEAIAVSALCPPGITETKLCPTTSEGISTFSSRGPEIEFIAPGVRIPSTVPASNDPSGIKAYSGTSMACPHVAGLAALAVAKGAQGVDAVRSALKGAATALPGMSASEQGAGLVDAARLR